MKKQTPIQKRVRLHYFNHKVFKKRNLIYIKMTKRIYNPVTKKYYEVIERTTKSENKGEIKGLWSSKKTFKEIKNEK